MCIFYLKAHLNVGRWLGLNFILENAEFILLNGVLRYFKCGKGLVCIQSVEQPAE